MLGGESLRVVIAGGVTAWCPCLLCGPCQPVTGHPFGIDDPNGCLVRAPPFTSAKARSTFWVSCMVRPLRVTSSHRSQETLGTRSRRHSMPCAYKPGRAGDPAEGSAVPRQPENATGRRGALPQAVGVPARRSGRSPQPRDDDPAALLREPRCERPDATLVGDSAPGACSPISGCDDALRNERAVGGSLGPVWPRGVGPDRRSLTRARPRQTGVAGAPQHSGCRSP